MTDIVRLMHYDPRWPQEFEQTRSGILHGCLGWVTEVLHIGSTAVNGMVARPVIDVIAALSDQEQMDQGIEAAVPLIEGLNFRKTETPMWAAETIVLRKPRSGETTHRVFLTYHQSPFYQSALRVREALRNDRELSLRFEETKVSRWKRGEGDPVLYDNDKSVFFAHLIEQSD